MIEITDLTDERVRHYSSLKFTPDSHIEENLLIAEGEKVVQALLNSNLEIISIFALPEFYQRFANLIESKNIPNNSRFFSNKSLMNEIIGFKLHSGVLAMAKRPNYYDINQLSDKIVALNGIVNSENVGAIIRNCAAFGVDSLIIDPATSSPYLRRSVRVSMGNVFDIKVCNEDDLALAIQELKILGYKIFAAEITPNAIPVNKVDFSGKYVIIFGTESQGVQERILNLCDNVIYIPINPKVNSINVAASSATILYESTIKRE